MFVRGGGMGNIRDNAEKTRMRGKETQQQIADNLYWYSLRKKTKARAFVIPAVYIRRPSFRNACSVRSPGNIN